MIDNFCVHAFHRNPGLYDFLYDSMARVQSVDNQAVFVFVSDASVHHSEWLKSVTPTDRHGLVVHDFCNLSGCEHAVLCCPTHIAGNRLDLVMTDVPDIVDVIVGTPLSTSDHFFVSCVEQSVQEYNFRSIVFLQHRTNWDSVCSAVSVCSALHMEHHFEVS